MTILQEIKKIRESEGLSYRKAARELGISDVSFYYIEKGIKFPRKKTRDKFDALFGKIDWDTVLKEGNYTELTKKRNSPKQHKIKKGMKVIINEKVEKAEILFPRLMKFENEEASVIFLADNEYKRGFHGTILYSNKEDYKRGSAYLFWQQKCSIFNGSITLSND